jgi:hypothetical protein
MDEGKGDEGTGDAGAGTMKRGRVGSGAYWGVMAAVLFVSVLPVFLTRFPPLHDYPNHLARAHVLHKLEQVAAFREAFAAAWHPYPNLAMDLCMAALLRVAEAVVAGQLFLASLPLLLLLGADRLSRAIHGGASWTAPLAGFLVWNGFLFYGFVNYVFGVGLFLLALAAWIRLHREPSWPRLAVASLLATACYLAHETSYVFLVASALVWGISERRPPLFRNLAWGIFPLLPPLTIKLLSQVPPAHGPWRWDWPAEKLKGPAMLLVTYEPLWDMVVAALFISALALLLRRFWPPNRPALLASALFFAAFVLAPTEARGGWSIDRRFLLPAALLGLCAFRPALNTRALQVLYGAAVALVLARSAGVAAFWRSLGADLERRAALLQMLPRGVSVFGFACVDSNDKFGWTRQMGLVYLHQYAALFREAQVSGLFCHANQQPLRASLPGIWRRPNPERPPEDFDWPSVFTRYQYVFATRLDDRYRRFLEARCRVLAADRDTVLFGECQAQTH